MDHKDFYERGKPRPESDLPPDKRWWTMEPEEASRSITSVLETLKDYQRQRLAQYILSARLYGNLPLMGLLGFSASKLAASQNALRSRLTYNVVQSVIDTAQSKMVKNKPKPYFLSSGGNYRIHRKAKLLNRFIEGAFYENRAYDEGAEAFRQGAVFGDGITHVFEKNGRVAHEPVLPFELWIDEVEATYGKPRQLHRVKNVDREVLLALYPKKADVILKAGLSDLEDTSNHSYKNVSDMVTVRQSWHLPSGPKAKDGKTIVTVDGGALTEMLPWEHDVFPFARFKWSPRLWGYWSQGIAEQIQNIQLQVNELLAVIQRSLHLGGAYKIFLEMGSKVVKEAINNEIGGIVYYRGAKPEYVVPQSVDPVIFQEVNQQIQRAYEQVGISTMNATGQKPVGLNSGKAMREFDDIAADRFLTPGQRYQTYYLDLARLDLMVARDIASRHGGHYKVRTPSKGFLEGIDLADADLSEEEYSMQCFPISSLPSDPAGRLQTVQEYVQAGFYTPRQAKKLLDFPDLESVDSGQQAAEDYLCKVLDEITDEGKYTPPEPSDDLALADELVAERYQEGKLHGLDEEKLALLLLFRAQVQELQDAAQQEQQMKQMQAQQEAQVQQGVPQAPPVSDLMPQAT